MVADAAQSFGASLDGNKVGTLATYTATSFYPSKPLGGYGDGGAVFTDDDDRAARLRALRNHGKGPGRPDTECLGLNSRLDSIQAAILLEKLRLFPGEILARQKTADRYNEGLASVAKVPVLMAGATFGVGAIHHRYRGSRRSRQSLPRGGRPDRDPLCERAQLPAALPRDSQSADRPRSGGVAGEARDQPAHASLSQRRGTGSDRRRGAAGAHLIASQASPMRPNRADQ